MTTNHLSFRAQYYLTLLISFLLIHWLCGLTVLEIEHIYSNSSPPNYWILSALSLTLHVILAYLATTNYRKNPRAINWQQKTNRFILNLSLVLTAFASAVWIEKALHMHSYPLICISIFLLILIVGQSFIHNAMHHLKDHVDLELENKQQPKKTKKNSDIDTLIICMSPSNPPILSLDNKTLSICQKIAPHKQYNYSLSSISELIEAVKIDKFYWNWQQTLRAITSRKNLKKIVLVGSKGNKGSAEQFKTFVKLIEILEPSLAVKIDHSEEGQNFLEYAHFREYLVKLIYRLENEKVGVRKSQVAIDVTGGQATASVAAAAATFNRSTVCQYIDTTYPHDRLTYDIMDLSPITPEGGH